MIRLNPTIGHLLLFATITLEFYRQEASGGISLALQLVRVVTFFVAAAYFVYEPKAFFFGHPKASLDEDVGIFRHTKTFVAWCFVTGIPVAWLMLVTWMTANGRNSFLLQLFSGYLFYFWLAGSRICSKFLFPRK